MKIVHLVHFFQPGYVGGIQRYVAELAHRQQEAGLDVSIFTVELPQTNGSADPGAKTAWIQGNGSLDVRSRRSWGTFLRTPLYPPLLRDIGRLRADVVHIHGPSPWFDVALIASRPRSRRTVLTLHNTFPRSTVAQKWLGRIAKTVLRNTLALSDAVIASHEGFAAELLGPKIFARLGNRLHFVPPGVDHGRFQPTGAQRELESVLFVAHVRPEKGLHVLIDAMQLLPELRLQVMATVSYEHRYFETMRAYAAKVLGERVHFLVDPDHETLVDAYGRAGCVVVPSLGLESWNLVLLEAAACGAACVRTDLPGLGWADFAISVRPNDPHQLAHGIRAALARWYELGERARDAAGQYSWERTHLETLAAYQPAGS